MRRGAPRRLARVATLALIAVLAVGGGMALAAQGDIFTVAGTGTAGYNGDGIAAATAQLSVPTAVTAMPDGGYLVVDQGNSRVRRVFPSGVIATIAGSGVQGFGGDNGLATNALLSAPNGAAALPDGSILIADSSNNRVRQVAPGGTITTVAGDGSAAFGGDGDGAQIAQINFPTGLAVRPDGSYLIVDTNNNRIRQVSPSGIITTVAGTGVPGSAGDGGLATQAQLFVPAGVAFTPDGGYLIADRDNNRIRKVSPGAAGVATITTVAGNGVAAFGGDGGPAIGASLNAPIGVTVTPDGGFLIADTSNSRVRKVSPAGVMSTVAGNGTGGFAGDGGPAVAAQLNGPFGVAVNAAGNYLIADTSNHRVRLIDAVGVTPAPIPVQPLPLPQPKPLAPVADKTVVVTEVSGRVLVRLPGSKRFIELSTVRELPLGTVVNATAGKIRITSAANGKGTTQTAVFYDGVFKIGQTGPTKRLTTVLTLFGPKPTCAKPKAKRSQASRKGKSRRLWGDGKGRFQTKGQYSSATVRGTKWLVEDNCKGTLTKVAKGSVTVRDFVKGKNVIVKAGDTYLAKARK